MTTTDNKTAPKNEIPDVALKVREQLLSTVKQGQQISLEAAQTWVKAVAALPVLDQPKVPGATAMPSVHAAAVYSFDVAADLLASQREFVLQMADLLVPKQSV